MISAPGYVLIVDDNALNRKLLERALIEQGCIPESAVNGKQALELLRGSRGTGDVGAHGVRPQGVRPHGDRPGNRDAEGQEAGEVGAAGFDVVLLDILMPVMDGYQTLQEIKADPELRHIPVIMISGLDEIDSVVRCIEMGAEDYLSKPFNPLLLKARLNASLEKKKLRDLERAYLQQEVALRQSEKLATLGQLSAGMAHELNNPASAARRGVDQLAAAVSHWQAALLDIARGGLPPAQVEALQALDLQARERGARPAQLDPLTRSEREWELEVWLEDQRIQNPWEISPTLVCLGCAPRDLDGLAKAFPAGQRGSLSPLPAVFSWLNAAYTIYSLLAELGQGARRISAIVEALKSYSYLDQAPVVSVDVNESLESTLALLSGRLDEGITVRREYAADLPHIQAYGSELTQVWTHLFENALDAIAGGGTIAVRSRWEAPWVVVEVEDNGPGIPEAIQSKIFDPFFTTKPPGLGAGLGLSVSHNIIVQKHSGRLSFQSQPGKTVFDVRLPVAGQALS